MRVMTLKALRRTIPGLTKQDLSRLSKQYSDAELKAWAERLGLAEHELH